MARTEYGRKWKDTQPELVEQWLGRKLPKTADVPEEWGAVRYLVSHP